MATMNTDMPAWASSVVITRTAATTDRTVKRAPTHSNGPRDRTNASGIEAGPEMNNSRYVSVERTSPGAPLHRIDVGESVNESATRTEAINTIDGTTAAKRYSHHRGVGWLVVDAFRSAFRTCDVALPERNGYMRSGASMPRRLRPRAITRAVRSHSARRLSRVAS
jgi:hypothetical protein